MVDCLRLRRAPHNIIFTLCCLRINLNCLRRISTAICNSKWERSGFCPSLRGWYGSSDSDNVNSRLSIISCKPIDFSCALIKINKISYYPCRRSCHNHRINNVSRSAHNWVFTKSRDCLIALNITSSVSHWRRFCVCIYYYRFGW